MRLLHRTSRTKLYAARATIALAVLAVLSGCKDNKTTTEPQSITLTAGTPSTTISSVTSGSVPLLLTRNGGYTGSVAITFEGLPSGVTATADPITGTGTSSTATFVATAAALGGTSTVTIRGTGTGSVAAVTTTVQVTVAQAAIGLTLGASSASAPQNGSATVGITIVRQNGFAGAVTLAAEGLPNGVTATFAPTSIVAGSTTSTLTLAIDGSATAASSPITIRAKGTGIADQVGAVQLTITQSGTPDYSLTASPAAVTALAGANALSTINIVRAGGFVGNVALTATIAGSPPGVTASFAPNPASANSSVLTIATTAATPAGTYNVTVTGSSAGTNSHTVAVSLVVSPLSGVTFTFAPATASVAQSGQVTNAITIARVGGLTGDVVLTAENLPTGVTASFAPSTVLAANTTSTLTLAATGAAPLGTSNVIVRATQGATSTTGTLSLTVTGPAGFSTALSAATVSVAQAASGSLTANITRNNGFAGTVNLAVTGLPAAVTTTFTPSAAVDGTTATINFAVAGAVPVGAYTGTLTSTATGATTPPVTFTLNVTAGVGGNSVVWQFCDPARIPVFFAVRDGNSGAWTALSPTSNAYTFALSQATGGVAYVLPSGASFATTVFLQSKAEIVAQAAAECSTNPGGGKTVSGTVTGLAAGTETATISLGGATATANAGIPGFTLNNVATGAQDLVAARSVFNLTTFTMSVDKLIIRRALNAPAGGNIAALNFGAAEAFAPVASTITVPNIGADQAQMLISFIPAAGGSALLGTFLGTTGISRPSVGVPTAQLVAGDLHQATVVTSSGRGALAYYRDASVTHAVTLGAVLDAPTASFSVTNSVFRPRLQGNIPTDYGAGFGAGFTQSGNGKSVTISATRAYFAGATYDLEVPDLGALNGFNAAAWGLSQNTNTTYSLSALGNIVGAPVDGTNYVFAQKSGAITSSQTIRK